MNPHKSIKPDTGYVMVFFNTWHFNSLANPKKIKPQDYEMHQITESCVKDWASFAVTPFLTGLLFFEQSQNLNSEIDPDRDPDIEDKIEKGIKSTISLCENLYPIQMAMARKLISKKGDVEKVLEENRNSQSSAAFAPADSLGFIFKEAPQIRFDFKANNIVGRDFSGLELDLKI